MKKTLLIALAVIVSGAFTTANAEKKGKKKQNVATPVETVTLKTSSDTLSYAAGKFHTEGLAPFLKSKYGIDDDGMALERVKLDRERRALDQERAALAPQKQEQEQQAD